MLLNCLGNWVVNKQQTTDVLLYYYIVSLMMVNMYNDENRSNIDIFFKLTTDFVISLTCSAIYKYGVT